MKRDITKMINMSASLVKASDSIANSKKGRTTQALTADGRKRVTFNIDASLWKLVQDAAYSNRMTQSDFIEQCIQHFIDTVEIDIEPRPDNVRWRGQKQ